MKGRVEFEDAFRRVLHAAIARLGTPGVFAALVSEIGGREVLRLAAEAFSAKEVRRWLDEPDDGAVAPLPDWARDEMEALMATAGGRITVSPEELHKELGDLAAWDSWAREKGVTDWTEVLIGDLSDLFTHLTGSDAVGNEVGPRVNFIGACLQFFNPSADELIGPVEAEEISRNRIRELLRRR